jgi:hypothetical protein
VRHSKKGLLMSQLGHKLGHKQTQRYHLAKSASPL